MAADPRHDSAKTEEKRSDEVAIESIDELLEAAAKAAHDKAEEQLVAGQYGHVASQWGDLAKGIKDMWRQIASATVEAWVDAGARMYPEAGKPSDG